MLYLVSMNMLAQLLPAAVQSHAIGLLSLHLELPDQAAVEGVRIISLLSSANLVLLQWLRHVLILF